MRKIKVLLFSIILSSGLYAQQDSLLFTQNLYTIARLDTFSSPGFSITDSIYCDAFQPFRGRVFFGARVNGTVVTAPQFTFDSITQADTVGFTRRALTFRFANDTAPPFIVGPNGVIIWPIISVLVGSSYIQHAADPNDTIRINTYYYPLDIKESPLAHIYLYQISGHLNIAFGDAENLVQQVRIYDLVGQSIYSGAPDRSSNISTEGWSKSIYLCEISTFSEERRTFKFKLE